MTPALAWDLVRLFRIERDRAPDDDEAMRLDEIVSHWECKAIELDLSSDRHEDCDCGSCLPFTY